MAFVSSSNNNTISSNKAVNAAHGVTTASTQVNTTYSTNIDNLSDAVICSFFSSQPNSPQLAHEDLQQIHPWEAILKTFGSETLEQTFNRLQAIVSHLKFMYVPIEQDDLNQKFLSSLAPEWLVYTIVWRNRDDLDTMSLDDVYNHLKVYEPEVQKSAGSNSQNMAFISSSNTNSGKSEVSTVQGVSTSGVQVSTASTDVAAASLSHDTVCAYIATQPNGSQIKYEDITQIDDDDIEEMDIKWNLALLSMRADRFWKKTGKKITIQGSDVAGFDKSKVECFNCHKMGHFARECRAPRSQDKGRRESYKKDPKVEEPTPKAMIAIDGIR
ncbi:ribonuclease H-like domain-containing protein [Tanacetum coccineum]